MKESISGMDTIILLLLAIIPVILLCVFVFARDKRKEPIKTVFFTLFLGCLSVIPVIIVELLLDQFFPTDENSLVYFILNRDFISVFVNVLVGIALVEEFFKWLVIMKTSYFKSVMDEIYDGIVYGTFASLGFALVENILYVISYANQFGLSYGFEIGLKRGLISIPGHASFGIMMGFFLGYAKLWKVRRNSGKTSLFMILSLVVPILLHTVYDSLLMYNAHVVLFYLFIISLYITCFILVFKISKDDQIIFINRNNNPNYGNYYYNPMYQQNQNMNQNYNPAYMTNNNMNPNYGNLNYANPNYGNPNYGNSPHYCPTCGQYDDGRGRFCTRCGGVLR